MSEQGKAGGASRREFLKTASTVPALALAKSASARAEENSAVKRPFEEINLELEEYGFVVLHDVIARQDAAELEKRVKDILSRRPDAGKPEQHLGGVLNHIDPKDDALFLPLVTQPVCLQLARRLLGEGFQMTEVGCRWRKPGAPAGPIHGTRPLDAIDRAGLPMPNVCFVLAISWMINDLTKDMGATFYLPFSHHAPHGPRANVHYKHLVPIEAPAGSLVIHHGGVWHNFGPNTTKDKERVGIMGGYFPAWMDPVSVGWQPMKRSVRERMPKEVQGMNKHVGEG